MTTDLTTAQPPPAALTPADMLKIAVDQGADLDKLEKFMELAHRWEADQARKAFNEAVANFKPKAPRLVQRQASRQLHVRAKTGPGTATRTLDSMTQKLAPALAKWGLSHSWSTAQDGDRITRDVQALAHREGHFEEVTSGRIPRTLSGSKNAVQVDWLDRRPTLSRIHACSP